MTGIPNETTDRVQVYHRDGTLIKSYGLKDFLTEEELPKVRRSVSHTQWLGYDKPNKRWYWLNEEGSHLEFLTMTGRKVQIMACCPQSHGAL